MYEIVAESGRYYSVNAPLKEGIDDNSKLFNTPFLCFHFAAFTL